MYTKQVRLEIKTIFQWHIYSVIFVPKIIGIRQQLLKLSLVVRWYTFWDIVIPEIWKTKFRKFWENFLVVGNIFSILLCGT